MNLFGKIIKDNDKVKTYKRLVLSEKREVGLAIAAALGCSCTADGYIEGPEYIITWTNGHIFTLKDPEDYDMAYKKWNINMLPIIPDRFEIRIRNDKSKIKQFDNIKKLINREDIADIILATDSAREGELIGRYALEQLNNIKPVYRFWSSSLTKSAIIEGFKKLKIDSEYDGYYHCARARAELDFLIGINFTRAYSLYNQSKITVGRCITVLLALICKRDEEIDRFNEEVYSELIAKFSAGYSGKYDNDGNSKIDKIEALKIKNCIENKEGTICDIKEKTEIVKHPLLFDLTEIQRVLNRKYGYTPKQTVDALEDLYLIHKVISYPRTSSSFITNNEVNELPKIFKSLSFGKFEGYSKYCLGLKKLSLDRVVNDDLVSDHHALIPLENENLSDKYSKFNEREKNIFDEIVFRFFSVFYSDYQYKSFKIVTNVEKYKFLSNVRKIIKLGWRKVYSENLSDDESDLMADIKVGDKVNVNEACVVDKRTKPVPHYTDDTLLEIMKNPKRLIEEQNLKQALLGRGIGTEATRADLIEALIEKEYIKRDQGRLMATELGKSIIKCIDIPLLKSVDLTADIEFNLEKIARNEISKEVFMREATNFVIEGIKYIRSKEPIIKEVKSTKSLGICLKCKTGKIIKNKTGYGCTNLKNGCNFYISGNIKGTMIDETQVKKLLNTGKTDMMYFYNDSGKYRARIIYNRSKEKTEFGYK